MNGLEMMIIKPMIIVLVAVLVISVIGKILFKMLKGAFVAAVLIVGILGAALFGNQIKQIPQKISDELSTQMSNGLDKMYEDAENIIFNDTENTDYIELDTSLFGFNLK